MKHKFFQFADNECSVMNMDSITLFQFGFNSEVPTLELYISPTEFYELTYATDKYRAYDYAVLVQLMCDEPSIHAGDV